MLNKFGTKLIRIFKVNICFEMIGQIWMHWLVALHVLCAVKLFALCLHFAVCCYQQRC